MAEFVHLHNHSDFSLLRASTTIKDLVQQTRHLGQSAVALTDDGNLFGALRFYKECLATQDKKGEPLSPIKPLIGCDLVLAPGSRHDKTAGENAKRFSRLVLLAQNENGYRNISKLSSIGYTEGFYYRPRIDKEVLATLATDVVALSGGMSGEIPQLILRNRLDEARAAAAWYRDLFGTDHFFLELTDHQIPDQKIINQGLLDLSKTLGIPVVATNDTYYATAEDWIAHDILLCIGNKNKRADQGRFKFSSQEFYLKSPAEMAALFGHIPEALSNTLRIAEMVDLKLNLPGPLLPDYEIPLDFQARSAEICAPLLNRLAPRFEQESPAIQERLKDPVNQYFIWESHKGLIKRYGDQPAKHLIDRLDYELFTIIKMGFVGYFLIVWDFIAYAKQHGIPVGPGRGSGAGSIVAYSLAITDIEPLRYNLLFERFLNPERVSMPDFDIDFCYERRQEVIDYVTRKYGEERVGQIITFGTLKAKAVIRDVARVLDLSFQESDVIAKLIPEDLKITIPKALEQEPRLKELYDQGSVYQELIDIAGKLEGLNRHASTHAAGIVIGKDILTNYVPLFRDPKTGAVSTQFTMDLLEECGLVKMDFLGLKTLTLIQNTEAIIRRTQDPNFDIESASETDPTTFRMLGEGKSAAVFQFDGEGMQRTLEQAKPTCIEDLIALNALYRPGPLEYIPQFIDCKWGRAPITYPHSSLETILKETYGVIVYQEQVMQAAQIVGGYSLGGADLLRRAMGKKKAEEMAKHRDIFRSGAARAHGLTEAQADTVFDILEKFAGYGFNKSHAAAYSVLAYKTAFLKANFPAEFMAANLTNEINSPDTFKLYLAETKAMGLKLSPPNINQSEKYFTVVNGEVVFGLMGLKGIGSAVVDEILNVRAKGRFTSITDFLERVDLRCVNRRALEILVLSGAMRDLSPKRKPLVDALDRLMDVAVAKKADQSSGQTSLFAADPNEEFPTVVLGDEEFELIELLKNEKDILGYYVSGNPLDQYRNEWERSTTLDLSRLEAASGERTYHLVAMLVETRVITTKRGARMGFARFEDYNGSIESVLFAENLRQFEARLIPDTVLGLIGTIDFSRDFPQFILKDLVEPDQLPEKDAGEVHVRIHPLPTNTEELETRLYALRAALLQHHGRSKVLIHLGDKPHDQVVRTGGQLTVRSLPETMVYLQQQAGVSEVWKLYPAMGKIRPKPVKADDLVDELGESVAMEEVVHESL